MKMFQNLKMFKGKHTPALLNHFEEFGIQTLEKFLLGTYLQTIKTTQLQ